MRKVMMKTVLDDMAVDAISGGLKRSERWEQAYS